MAMHLPIISTNHTIRLDLNAHAWRRFRSVKIDSLIALRVEGLKRSDENMQYTQQSFITCHTHKRTSAPPLTADAQPQKKISYKRNKPQAPTFRLTWCKVLTLKKRPAETYAIIVKPPPDSLTMSLVSHKATIQRFRAATFGLCAPQRQGIRRFDRYHELFSM